MWEGDSELVQVGISQKSGDVMCGRVVITSVLIRRVKVVERLKECGLSVFFQRLVRGVDMEWENRDGGRGGKVKL